MRSYEHDILGNRIRRNATTNNHAYPMRYDWDVLNRASTIAKPSGGASYSYRADGQRIEKVEGVTFAWVGSKTSGQYDTNYAQNRPSSRYYYDGQMGFEDDYNPSGTVTQVNRYILGARGIDRVARTESGNTTLAYPMYDGHGNMRALLTRNGTSYSTGNWKTYDVWGSVRSGGSSGDPKQGYVASIGHVSDSESSLIYMRARYYEPATGRFLSQDSLRDGSNWYIYGDNVPTERVDADGNEPVFAQFLTLIIGMLKQFGFRQLASAVYDMSTRVLAERLKIAAHSLIRRGMIHQAEAAALVGRQDWFGKAAAGAAGRLAAKELSAGLTLLSLSHWLHHADDIDDLGYYLLMP